MSPIETSCYQWQLAYVNREQLLSSSCREYNKHEQAEWVFIGTDFGMLHDARKRAEFVHTTCALLTLATASLRGVTTVLPDYIPSLCEQTIVQGAFPRPSRGITVESLLKPLDQTSIASRRFSSSPGALTRLVSRASRLSRPGRHLIHSP